MSEKKVTAASLTRLAIHSSKHGEPTESRKILAEALSLNLEYEAAWLWFAAISTDPGERKFCLLRANNINSSTSTRAALHRLEDVRPVTPPEIEGMLDPELPQIAELAAGVSSWRGRSRRSLLFLGLSALVIIAGVFAAWFVTIRDDSAPVYIAVATSMTGNGAPFGKEIVNSVQMAVDDANQNGGANGHRIELLVYDDKDDPATAKQVAQQIVDDGRAMIVIGHRVSAASVAAGPIYAQAGIPVISSTSTADNITRENPWFFRTVFSNGAQGHVISAYIRYVLNAETLTVISSTSAYGQTLKNGLITEYQTYGIVLNSYTINEREGPDAAAGSIESIATSIKGTGATSPIVLALPADFARPVIIALRRAGVTNVLVGGDALGADAFLDSFALEPEEVAQRGFFTNNLYAASPLFTDSLTSEGLRWFVQFKDRYGFEPTWRGATSFEAGITAVTMMDRARVSQSTSERAALRTSIRDQLASLRTKEAALSGLIGPIYFDDTQSAVRTVVFGVAKQGRFASAPVQLVPSRSAATGAPDEIVADGQVLERKRIVFAGISMNEVGDLDAASTTFTADFFIWLKYSGNADAVDIVFPNATDPGLSPGDPIVTSISDDGLTYQLFRVHGTFEAPLDFHNFPFDQQHLTIEFQNRGLSSSQLVYAVDRELLDQPQSQRLTSGINASASINSIYNWRASALDVYQGTVGSTARMGDPTVAGAQAGIEYSQFISDVTIKRELASFLVKNLLPLGLLIFVTYISLFFPASSLGTRVSFGVTSILTGAVLLSTVTSSLPDVGYTVAIEWGFYAFLLLSSICILIGLVGDRWYEARHLMRVRRLVVGSRIFYPAYVLAVVALYAWNFG